MKKVFLTLSILGLLAAGCNQSAQVQQQSAVNNAQPTVVQATPTPTSATIPTATATPTTTADMSNWKTYTNIKYGFEFRYPQSMDLNIVNQETIKLTPQENRLKDQPADNSGEISFQVEPNSKGLDVQTWLAQSNKYDSKAKSEKALQKSKTLVSTSFEEQPIIISSIKGLDQYIDGEGGSERYVFIPKQKNIIAISLKSDFHFTKSKIDDRVPKLVSNFNTLLSTFKFTK